jgi:hypothetical protein
LPAVSDGLKTIEPACPKACSSCPWRLANQGSKPDPHKFYTPANLKRLWSGMRDGYHMSCHPTDPRMAEFAGYEPLAARDTAHECTGSLILVQREFMLFQQMCEADPKGKKTLQAYRRRRPNGLTRNGLLEVINRGLFGHIPILGGGVKMATPDLSDLEIGYPALDAPARIR